MEERPSPADVPGYIYTYEIRSQSSLLLHPNYSHSDDRLTSIFRSQDTDGSSSQSGASCEPSQKNRRVEQAMCLEGGCLERLVARWCR
jgi:hypothetical protein